MDKTLRLQVWMKIVENMVSSPLHVEAVSMVFHCTEPLPGVPVKSCSHNPRSIVTDESGSFHPTVMGVSCFEAPGESPRDRCGGDRTSLYGWLFQ